MKSVSELTNFYYTSLYPALQTLEKRRKSLVKRLLMVGFLYSTLFFIFVSLFLFTPPHLEILAFSLVAYLGIGGVLFKYLSKDYTQIFKQTIIAPLINAMDSSLSYDANAHIPDSYFSHSKLLSTHPDKITGNDYVKGNIDGVFIEFSDIHAQKKHTNNKGHTSWSTLFQGLFIVSEFNKHFKGTTVVLPDTAQHTFGSLIGHWLQAHNFSRTELIKMDNVAFEKEFVVYGSDQIESRYILTHSLMHKLLNFKKLSSKAVSISFVGKNIFLAIHYNKDLFEPSIFHSLLKYKIAHEYIHMLHLAISIVKELKLNQKLWSKV